MGKQYLSVDRNGFCKPTRPAENRIGCKGVVAKSHVCPNDLARLWDRLD